MTEREVAKVRSFVRMLLRLAPNREMAADIEQEVVLKIWERWDSLTNWEQYARQVVVTTALDHAADLGKMVSLRNAVATCDYDAAALLIAWQQFHDSLGPRDRVIWQASFLGVEDEDMAKMVGLKAKRVRYILGRLRAKFREFLQGPSESY